MAGATPFTTNNPGLVPRIAAWAVTPFNEQMSLWGWIAFTILVVTVTFLWTRVLEHIEEID
jgi:hypothetical protein